MPKVKKNSSSKVYLAKENEQLRLELAKLKATHSSSSSNAHSSASASSTSTKHASSSFGRGTGAPDTTRRRSKVPRPSVEAGRGASGKKGGFSLMEEMEVEKDTYNNARASVRGILSFHHPRSELRVLTFYKMEDRKRGVIKAQVIKAHPWLDHNYKDAWPVQSLIQTVLANIKTQDRRTGRINADDNDDQNIDPTDSDNDSPDVNERAVSTRPHEEGDGSGGEEREVEGDGDVMTDLRGQTPPKPRARRSNREILQDGLSDSSDEGRQDAQAVTQSTITNTNDHLISPRPSRTQAKRNHR